jgi:hypothetical protein
MFGSPVVLQLVVVAAVAVSSAVAGWTANGWRLDAKISKITETHAKELADAQHKARQTEAGIQAEADKLRAQTSARLRDVNSRLDAATSRLRDLSAAQGGGITPNPRVGLAPQGSPRTFISREDGEFLLREAARADTIREGYYQCLAQYGEVRKQLNK